MDIKQRRWLYSLFIFLFFVISPLVVAYSLGYRLDTNQWKVSKVGALYIKSYPAGARIYVADKLTKRKTPSQVINIPVGLNTFKVEKDTYQPWTKKMNVTAGETTFVQDILLFKQDFKKQVLGNGGSQMVPSINDDAYIYLNKQQELVVINTTNRTANVITKLPPSAVLKQWSNDERTVLYSVGANWYTLALAEAKSTQIITKPAKVVTKATLGANGNDIIIISNQTLYRWNTSFETLDVIMTNVQDFAVAEGMLAILTSSGLSLTDINETKNTISPLENTTDLKIVQVFKDVVLLTRGDQYWIWRDGAIQHRLNATSVNHKKNTLLFSNGYELSSYDLGNNSINVVDRTSTVSTNVSWHPSTNYFARVQNTILDLVELDSRGDKRHVIPIGTLTASDSYLFDPKGEYIFILTPEENYSLELQ